MTLTMAAATSNNNHTGIDGPSQSNRSFGTADVTLMDDFDEAPEHKSLSFRDVFLGRDAEILKLEGIFRRTAAGRSSVKYPNLVLVGGASGAGKSTLIRKLHDHLHAIEEELFWINGKFEEGQQKQTLDIDTSLNAGDGDSSAASCYWDTLSPFAAIVDAFSDFCNHLEEEEPETIDEVSEDILDAVGNQGRLLTSMIPSLTKIIGEQEEGGHIRESQLSNLKLFHMVFQKFLQALASQVRTVVLVFDDIQRADTASLELLHSLLTSNLKHVLFIGTYRSDEVKDNEDHRFNKWINGIKGVQAQQLSEGPQSQQSTTVTSMELSGLDLENINTLISNALSLPPDDTRSLAYIVHIKTEGNTFFATQYLLFLNKIELLWFDPMKGCWGWDESAIREQAAVSTTLLDFMRDKMSHSEVAPKILPVAACLGTKFSQKTLAMILADIAKIEALQEFVEVDPDNVQDLLKHCLKEGFIENCGNKNYSFAHDKMQEAALTIHPVNTMQKIRYEAGGTLFRKLSVKELEEKLFVIVNLLNTSQQSSVTTFEIACLNLQAARKSKQMAAFWSAATYIESALFFFPSEHGDLEKDAHREFLLEVCSLGAEIEGAIGRLDRMQEYCDRVFDSSFEYTVYERLRVQNVWIDCSANSGGKMTAALEYCLEVLEELGCSFPKTTVVKGIKSVAQVLKTKAPKNIPNLEDVDSMVLMTDTAKLESMKLLDRAATYSYVQENQLVFTMCVTRMVRWTIRYGISEKSPGAFAFLGLVLMHVLGDFTAGSWYGELSVSMMHKLEELAAKSESEETTNTDPATQPETEPATQPETEPVTQPDPAVLTQSKSRATFLANGLVIYWTKPLQSYKNEMLEGYEAGMRVGDTESAFWNAYFHIALMFSGGMPLTELEKLCRTYIAEMIALRREEPEAYTRICWQGFLNLTKHSAAEGTSELLGSALSQTELDCIKKKKGVWGSKLIPYLLGHMKTVVCAYFGDYEQGAKLAVERGDSLLVAAPGQPFGITDPFLRGVCLYAAAHTSKHRSSYKQHGQKCRSTLRSWVKKGVPAAVHQLKLLDAEHEACMGHRDVAIGLYREACVAASDGRFNQDAALANERLAKFLLASTHMHEVAEGKTVLAKSVTLYEEWGAKGKVDKLFAEHPDVSPTRISVASLPRISEAASSHMSQHDHMSAPL